MNAVRKLNTSIHSGAGLSARERRDQRKLVRGSPARAEISGQRIDHGVWDQAKALHPDHKGGVRESHTVRDLAAMAGGAGVLFKRGSISRECFNAAAWLCAKAESALATGRSVSDYQERVDCVGSGGDGGMHSLKAAFAGLAKEAAMSDLTATQREVIEAVVFRDMSLGKAAEHVCAPEWQEITRAQTRRAKVLAALSDGLMKVHDVAAWRGWA